MALDFDSDPDLANRSVFPDVDVFQDEPTLQNTPVLDDPEILSRTREIPFYKKPAAKIGAVVTAVVTVASLAYSAGKSSSETDVRTTPSTLSVDNNSADAETVVTKEAKSVVTEKQSEAEPDVSFEILEAIDYPSKFVQPDLLEIETDPEHFAKVVIQNIFAAYNTNDSDMLLKALYFDENIPISKELEAYRKRISQQAENNKAGYHDINPDNFKLVSFIQNGAVTQITVFTDVQIFDRDREPDGSIHEWNAMDPGQTLKIEYFAENGEITQYPIPS